MPMRRRWNPETVEATDLPATTKAYLIEVGLPVGCEPFVFDSRVDGLPYLQEGYSLRVIGFYEETELCVDEAESAQVVFAGSSGQPECLVNTNVATLSDCLIAYKRYRDLAPRGDRLDHSLIGDLEARIRDADAEVLRVKGGFWRSILFELREGLI
jgi:SUKH-4 immunity protein of toxin-antitoxin system